MMKENTSDFGSESRFYVNKTGLELFDAIRAYGLGILISGLRYEEPEVTIKDVGYAYVLNVDRELPAEPDQELFEEDENKWRQIFMTVKARKDAKKKHPRDDLEEIISQDFEKILETHKRADFVPGIGKKVKEGRTLYQTLDVSAAKGFREEQRGLTYHEGSQLQADKYSWAIAILGAIHFISWRESEDFITILTPNPLDIFLQYHREIHYELDKENICSISSATALAHYSVKLAIQVAKREKAPLVKYDSVIFNVMQKTRQQPKPGGGGKYSLDFLEKLAERPQGLEALEKLNRLFPLSRQVKGIRQDIALATAEFLIRPSFENFRRWESLYIRGYINKKLPLWYKPLLEEIIKNVEAT